MSRKPARQLKTLLATAILATVAGTATADATRPQPQCSPANTALNCQSNLKSRLTNGRLAAPRATAAYGIDFAWTRISASQARAMGARFAASYYSLDGSKDWYLGLVNSYHAAGLGTVGVWETTASRALSGYAGGVSDARQAAADAQADGLGRYPVYFAVDFDETPGQAATVAAYFHGAQSVIGKPRLGAYGGYWTVKRLFDAGIVTYGWQTSAWSNGLWDRRAQLQQYAYTNAYDWDRAVNANYGQLPAGTGPTPTPTPPNPAPPAPAPRSNTAKVAFPVIAAGAHGTAVAVAQARLGRITVDGIFGPQTRARVIGYQRASGLTVDGVIGHGQTWPALLPLERDGDTNQTVRVVQATVGAAIDGMFGPMTRARVIGYQRAHRLAADGAVGRRTWTAFLR